MEINGKHVSECIKDALAIGKTWLNHEIQTASDNDIKSFLKIANLGSHDFTSSQLSNAGISPPYIGRLVGLKVIKKISRGRYKLMKAPIIAYYHALERGIQL